MKVYFGASECGELLPASTQLAFRAVHNVGQARTVPGFELLARGAPTPDVPRRTFEPFVPEGERAAREEREALARAPRGPPPAPPPAQAAQRACAEVAQLQQQKALLGRNNLRANLIAQEMALDQAIDQARAACRGP